MLDGNPLGLGDLGQPALDVTRLNAREIVTLTTRQDGHGNLVRFGRGKEELHMLRRFFQRFKQRVERLFGQHMNFVDNVNFESRPAGTDGNVLTQLANLFDAAVACPVDLQDVDIVAGANAPANLALVAWRGGGALQAVERFGKYTGSRCLADATRTGKQIGVSDALACDGARESLRHVLLTNQFVERLGPIAPSDHHVVAVVLVGRGSSRLSRIGHHDRILLVSRGSQIGQWPATICLLPWPASLCDRFFDRRREAPTQRSVSLWLLCFHPDQVRKAPIAETSRRRPIRCRSKTYLCTLPGANRQRLFGQSTANLRNDRRKSPSLPVRHPDDAERELW